MQPLLNIAIQAARRAGEIIVRGLNRVHRLDVRAKGQNDFVTRDRHAGGAGNHRHHAQAAIPSTPSSPRKAARAAERHEFLWIIDPLDGTTNFLHGYPAVRGVDRRAASRPHGARASSTTRCARSCSPPRAAKARSSMANASASARSIGLEGALIGTGFPYRSNLQWLDAYMAMLKAVMQADCRHSPSRRCRARSGLCRGRPARRILGTRPVALGHRRGNVADHRSRRHGRHAERRRIQTRRRHRRRHAEGLCPAAGAARAARPAGPADAESARRICAIGRSERRRASLLTGVLR